MKLNKEIILIVLWVIFGFVFVEGMDSVLHLITYLIYFAQSELGVSYNVLKFSMPVITLVLYLTTTFFLLKRMSITPVSHISFDKFPKRMLVLFLIISLILPIITNKLFSLYTKHSFSTKNIATSDFIDTHAWLSFSTHAAKWLVLILLLTLFIRKLNRSNIGY